MIVILVFFIFQIPIIYMDDSDSEDEKENDKMTNENTERNKNIPCFKLDDESEDGDTNIDRVDYKLELPVNAVKGTVV